MFIEEDYLQVLIEYHFKACAKVDLVFIPSRTKSRSMHFNFKRPLRIYRPSGSSTANFIRRLEKQSWNHVRVKKTGWSRTELKAHLGASSVNSLLESDDFASRTSGSKLDRTSVAKKFLTNLSYFRWPFEILYKERNKKRLIYKGFKSCRN